MGAAQRQSLNEFFPDIAALRAVQAQELAELVLRELVYFLGQGEKQFLHLDCYIGLYTGNTRASPYAHSDWGEVASLIAEAWGWLMASGLTASRPGDGTQGWVFVTRLGKRAATAEGFAQYRAAADFPKDKLHPAIAERCYGHFVRGLFDTAVFEAYKALEVAIREAAALPVSLIGVPLSRKAFAPEDGSLRDPNAEGGERQALSDLMAGAIGSYKNPHSHRNVAVSPEEAAEMIILASHLLRIIDSRRPTRS